MQRHLDHTAGAIDDLGSSHDHGVGLLLAEHGGSYLLRVSQIRDSSFNDLESGLFELELDLLSQAVGDLRGVRSQANLTFFKSLVGIQGNARTKRGLTLDPHVVLIIANFKRGRG
jgi:hypothetical protein